MLPAIVLLGVPHIAFPMTSAFFNCVEQDLIDVKPACPHRIVYAADKTMCCAEQQTFYGTALEHSTRNCWFNRLGIAKQCTYIFGGPLGYECCVLPADPFIFGYSDDDLYHEERGEIFFSIWNDYDDALA